MLADLVVVDPNPLENLKVLYGTGAMRLNDRTGKAERVGGVKYTDQGRHRLRCAQAARRRRGDGRARPCRHAADDHWLQTVTAAMALASFDITSTIDLQEVDNAVNQARKELAQRYDFKGSKAAIEFNKGDSTLALSAEDEFKLDAVWEILQTRLIRRQVPVKNLKLGDVEPASGGTVGA